MNFLAHMYLSGENEKLMIGNFIGDYVKGSNYRQYQDEIARGILLHREIDEFTDTHEITRRCKNLIRNRFGHYAGVAIDLYYDHFLALDFDQYHQDPLKEFTAHNFRILEEHIDLLPAQVQKFLPYMIQDNWLVNYSTVEGVQRSLNGVARRTPFKSNLEYAAQELLSHYEILRNNFHSFFPILDAHCRQYLTM